MAVNDRELAELRSALAPLALAGEQLAQDGPAERMIEAVHAGDSRRVVRVLEDTGVRGVTHRQEPPVKGRSREVFAYQPNERWHIEIHIEISKP